MQNTIESAHFINHRKRDKVYITIHIALNMLNTYVSKWKVYKNLFKKYKMSELGYEYWETKLNQFHQHIFR
jgi:hypothetical protein